MVKQISHNFGACNSLGGDPNVVSGFLSAVYGFGMMLSGNDVSEILLGERCFYLTTNKLILVLVSDGHNDAENRKTLETINQLFMDQYASKIDAYLLDLDSSHFASLPQQLIDLGILQANCGGMSDCSDCKDNSKSLPVESMGHMLREKLGSMNR
ncbi:MAG: hypothetical protein ACTSYL_06615 [Candidatus Thorarchaeota archaeon]